MPGDDLMKTTIQRSVPVVASGRVLQMRGIFDVPSAKTSDINWEVNLPIEDRPWNVGLIVGPSGCGKSTVARELFGDQVIAGYDWPADRSILDAFPAEMGIKEITGLLSSVGFSSPPSWMRPFAVLSTGEQFRVFVARALAESPELAVIDEFTSVVDRTVAQIGSAAIAGCVRRSNRKLIAVTCHYDVLDWLQPDWVYQPVGNQFDWRSLQRRPDVELEITCGTSEDWKFFKAHHYLSGEHHRSARCFLGLVGGRAAAFLSVLHFPHPVRSGWREHRVVVLPDFQGIGIGNRLSEYVGSLFVATGKPYRGTTSHPGFIQHRRRSPFWRTITKARLNPRHVGNCGMERSIRTGTRMTWSFEYIGPANPEDCRAFGLRQYPPAPIVHGRRKSKKRTLKRRRR